MKRQLFSFLFMGIPFSLSAAEDLESIKQQFIGDYELVRYVTFSEDGSDRAERGAAFLSGSSSWPFR